MIRKETYITRKNKQKITRIRIKMKMKRKKGYRRGKVGEGRSYATLFILLYMDEKII